MWFSRPDAAARFGTWFHKTILQGSLRDAQRSLRMPGASQCAKRFAWNWAGMMWCMSALWPGCRHSCHACNVGPCTMTRLGCEALGAGCRGIQHEDWWKTLFASHGRHDLVLPACHSAPKLRKQKQARD